MATTPKLILTDVPFVGDETVKPGDYGIRSKDSLVPLGKASRAIISGKAGFDERKTALDQATQSLADFCKGLAAHVMAIRKQFVNADGKVDFRGTSNAYKRFVSLNVYEPMFGTRPEGVDRNKWNRESGYSVFKTSLDRAMTQFVDDASALAPDDESFVPPDALKKPEQPNQVTPDSKSLIDNARKSKVTRKADGPDVNALINAGQLAFRMMVAYGDGDTQSIAPGLLKLTPNEAEVWQKRLVAISSDIRTVARIIEAKIADAAKADAVEAEATTEQEPDKAEELVEATA